ncbi:hypothetical protein [Streptomyces sp. NEAU-YJ-81]|uniref:hypothetical protein n=1 Tax=Streptomyces sp. NEAU-YJ-81 TaxID=2820288 RepID=UPI001FBA3294|nr:hypothetical protein [Streptomyces sp. NEAU-YJ-81]
MLRSSLTGRHSRIKWPAEASSFARGGPAIVAELVAAGHTVTGPARSDAAAARLESLGATPHRGSVDDLDSLRGGAEAAGGVLHMAYCGDFSDPDDMMRRDRTAIESLGQPLEHSGKPLVITSGTLVMPAGWETTEKEEPDTAGIAAFRIAGGRACLGFAAGGPGRADAAVRQPGEGPGACPQAIRGPWRHDRSRAAAGPAPRQGPGRPRAGGGARKVFTRPAPKSARAQCLSYVLRHGLRPVIRRIGGPRGSSYDSVPVAVSWLRKLGRLEPRDDSTADGDTRLDRFVGQRRRGRLRAAHGERPAGHSQPVVYITGLAVQHATSG